LFEVIWGIAIGRWSRAGADADADEDAEAKAGGGSSEGKSKGDSAVGPCDGVAEYAGRPLSALSWASTAALLASSSLFDIVIT
jgi:hypothetical protein